MAESINPLVAFSDHAAQLVERTRSSIVAVHGGGRRSSSGIHWRSGVIVTAEEVLERDEDVKITLPSGRLVEASLAGRDPTTDVAVLRFQPDGLPAASTADAAPLLCAGITTFNALRNAPAKAGDLVAVLGIGGLGHLGVQYAQRMGFEVAAVGRGNETAELARKLGAHHYIDSAATDPAAALQALGGAKVILITASGGKTVATTFKGLRPGGVSIDVGVGPEPIEITSMDLIFGERKVAGSLTGNPATGDATLRFSALSGVAAMIETVPLEQAPAAYAKMMAGKARFRMVLVMNNGAGQVAPAHVK